MYTQLLLLLSQEKFQVSHIILTVSDVEMLASRKVLLGLVKHLNVLDVGVVQRDSDFTPESVVLVSDQNIRSHVALAPFDGYDLAKNGASVEVRNLDDISRTQSGSGD